MSVENQSPLNPAEILWSVRGTKLILQDQPCWMGILNLTPDSFSDGGKYSAVETAVQRALQLIDEGADLLDLGGESTRPGAIPVPEDEELRRVVPVVEALVTRTSVPISIDTTKSRVAQECLAAGAHIINDISGLQFDPQMAEVCRSFGAGVVCMHIQGTPQTMQQNPCYEDVVSEIAQYFEMRRRVLRESGLSDEQLVWDPGVGFGKTADHNLQILRAVADFKVAQRPVLIGHSRKGFLKKLLARKSDELRPVDERLFGTIGISVAVAAQGANIIRVHDVAASRDAWRAFNAIRSTSPFHVARAEDNS